MVPTKRKAPTSLSESSEISTVSRKRPTDLQKRFSAAVAKWLQARNFTVGVPIDDVPPDSKTAENASACIGGLAKFAGVHFPVPSSLISFLLTSGAPVEQAQQALAPYAENCDLLALNLEGQPTLFLLMYADKLSIDQVLERFDIFLDNCEDIADLGLRFILSKTSPGAVYIYPVLVYSDPQKQAKTWSIAKQRGWYADAKVMVRAGSIDLTSERMEWAENNAPLYKYAKPLIDRLNAIGHKDLALNNAALAAILSDMRAPVARRRA